MVMNVGMILAHDAVNWTVVCHFAGVQYDGSIDEGSKRPELMGDQQNGSAFLHEAAKQFGEDFLVFVVDTGGWFIHDEELSLTGEGTGNECALLHAT